jgi:hypothetical protein
MVLPAIGSLKGWRDGWQVLNETRVRRSVLPSGAEVDGLRGRLAVRRFDCFTLRSRDH